MSKSRKKQKQSKANEKERLDRIKHPELFDENGERITKKGKRKKFTSRQTEETPKKKVDHTVDSFGNSIPSEKERRSEASNTKTSDETTHAPSKEHEFKTYVSNSAKKSSDKKVKTKYVFTKDAKRALGVVVACVVIALLAIIILVNALSDIDDEDDVVNSEHAYSLVSMTNSGKALVDGFGKFDNMWLNDNGTSYAGIYDALITVDDSSALTAAGQYPVEDGLFVYNEEHSTAAPLKKLQEEATQAEKELAEATENLTDEERQQLQDALDAESQTQSSNNSGASNAATPAWER